MYQSLIRPLFFQLPPESAHHLALSAMQLPGFRQWARATTGPCQAPVDLWGIRFRNPIGLAGGFDKDARILRQTHALGFGFTEVGTITPLPQPGNPKPRIFRLPRHQALINRLGFPNDGATTIRNRIARVLPHLPSDFPIAINIGKNKSTPPESAAADYVNAFRSLYDVGHLFVVNVSSPNTPGLRAFQEKDQLRLLLQALLNERSRHPSSPSPKPLLVKIAPDLEKPALADILELVTELQIDGIVATNTTIDHGDCSIGESGGLSGPPLREKSTAVIRFLHQESRGKLPLIGVGGIASRDDVLQKLDAGASLVQLYTGFIYQGPQVVPRLL